jgi:hypothetical protein
VIEIDVSHPSLDKLPIDAALGVPEVWRCEGGRLAIMALEGDAYEEREESLALPAVTTAALSDLLRESREIDPPDWFLHVRDWARSLPHTVP